MNLKDHLETLGYAPDHLAFLTQLPAATVQRALQGKPISALHAAKIAHVVSQHHGLHRGEALEPEDIGLNVVDERSLRGGVSRR